MIIKVPLPLKKLAENCSHALYIVGGYVRNFLISGMTSKDIDIAGAISVKEMKEAAEKCGFKVCAEYKRTGTVVLSYWKQKFEFTRFRVDEYEKGGAHKPRGTLFTDDIDSDALRRDFKCNAVYYDIKNDKLADPLGGAEDIKNRVLDTVCEPERVFCSDGLRLMRLARFAAELNFTPCARVLEGAKKYAANISDIAPERIFDEIKKILVSDATYEFSDKKGHYTGFKILEEIGVLNIIFPEITAGRGLSQRADFHKYDVLEHSLRTLLYADREIRLAAFLHDVGKPYCKIKYGTYRGHAEAGEKISEEILTRLKADTKTKKETGFLVRWHMFDLGSSEPETAIRKFIAANEKRFAALIKLKQADYSACKDDFSVCPTVERWTRVYQTMKSDGTPFSLKELKISALDLIGIGFKGKAVGEELAALFDFAVENPAFNDGYKLRQRAEFDFKQFSCGT